MKAPARPGGGGALHPWLGRHLVQALHEGVGLAQRRRALVRAVPRAARGGLPPHLRHAARLARADRHRERAGDHAHRQPPRREHAQHPGAGARRGDRASGAELVVVDPRFSVAASKARYWLPIKPGTDIALLLAWMNVILEEKALRRRVPREARGRPRRAPRARRRQDAGVGLSASPASAPSSSARRARLIASARPASLVHPGRHTTWYGDDTQRARAMAILAALLGSWGRRGGYVSHAKMSLPPYPVAAKAPHARQGGCGPAEERRLPRRDRGHRLGALRRDRARASALYDLKAWIVYGCNLMQALPDRRQTVKALQKLDLLVAIDVLPAEICGWSDVVLPEATYLERDDDVAAPGVQAAVPRAPPGGGAAAPRLEAGLVDREGARRAGRARRVLPVEGRARVRGRAAPRGRSRRRPRARDGRRARRSRSRPARRRGSPSRSRPSPRKIELRSEQLARLGFDPHPAVLPARGAAGRALPAAHGPRPDAHLRAHREQPAPRRALPGERGVGERGRRAVAAGVRRRRSRTASACMLVNQDGARSGPGAREGDASASAATASTSSTAGARPRSGSGTRTAAARPTARSSPATRSTRSWAAPA